MNRTREEFCENLQFTSIGYASVASGAIFLVLGFFVGFKRDLKHHPYPIIATACLTQASFFYTVKMNMYVLCNNFLFELFSLPFERLNILSRDSSFNILHNMSLMLSFLPHFMAYSVNAILLIDIYLMIKNPFYPRGKR